MIKIPHTFKGYSLSIDAIGYMGLITEVKPPQPKMETDKYRGAGMIGNVNLETGYGDLELEVKSKDLLLDVLVKLGDNLSSTIMTIRTDWHNDQGSRKGVTIRSRGRLLEYSSDDFKSGELVESTFKFALTYYEFLVEGEEWICLDYLNQIVRFKGVDRLEGYRQNLGF